MTPETPTFDLACPICTDTKFELNADRGVHDPQHCSRCARTFNTNRSSPFVDLTLTSGVTSRVYKESLWGGVEIFRNPLVSFVYERGWRQGFAWAGFPGVEREFEMAMDLLRPAYGKVLVDMSCGSGIFSRRFASSRRFSGVIAADYSESMLQQTQRTFDDDGFVSDGSVLLLRADVGRLPFPTGSVAAIHAGAAIHCWPNPTAAMAEISRVLAPGGVFVASTFLKAAAPLGQILGDDVVRPLNRFDPSSSGSGRSYRWWEEGELRDLVTTVGLANFQRERRLRFIMFSASKPVTNMREDREI